MWRKCSFDPPPQKNNHPIFSDRALPLNEYGSEHPLTNSARELSSGQEQGGEIKKLFVLELGRNYRIFGH